VVASGPDSQNGRGEGVGGVARHIELRRRGGGVPAANRGGGGRRKLKQGPQCVCVEIRGACTVDSTKKHRRNVPTCPSTKIPSEI
jgi:hypothetical protein